MALTLEQLEQRLVALEQRVESETAPRALVQAQTSLIDALRQTQIDHGRKLDKLDNRVDGIDSRLTRVEDKIDGLTHASSTILGLLTELTDSGNSD